MDYMSKLIGWKSKDLQTVHINPRKQKAHT